MLRRGVLSVAAFAQAQRTCAATAKGAVGAKAWLSASTGENEDPTPAKTKLTFTSSVYGKDPQAAAALSEEEAAEIEALRVKARQGGGGAAGAVAAPVHDSRNLYDSSLSQQAEDGKASGGIKREVSADTPDATRVAFGATAYGKDAQSAAAEVAAEVEELRKKAQGAGATAGAAAAPIHSSRSLFDSDLTQVFIPEETRIFPYKNTVSTGKYGYHDSHPHRLCLNSFVRSFLKSRAVVSSISSSCAPAFFSLPLGAVEVLVCI